MLPRGAGPRLENKWQHVRGTFKLAGHDFPTWQFSAILLSEEVNTELVHQISTFEIAPVGWEPNNNNTDSHMITPTGKS